MTSEGAMLLASSHVNVGRDVSAGLDAASLSYPIVGTVVFDIVPKWI